MGRPSPAESCTIERNHEVGVLVSGEGTVARLAGTVIADTETMADGTYGLGIVVADGAALTARSSTIARNREVGVWADGEGTLVSLTGVHVVDGEAKPDGTGGRGVEVGYGASLTLDSCTVERNREVGVLAGGEGTLVSLTDTVVAGTLAAADGTSGHGIAVQSEAALTAVSSAVERNHEVGVFAGGEGTLVSLEDTVVADTEPRDDGTFGRGINVQDGAALTAESCAVERNHDIGVVASGEGTMVSLGDSVVSGTARGALTVFAQGLTSQVGATLSGDRVSVQGTEGPGIYAGLGVVSCRGCDLADNAFAGALVTGSGTLDLSDSTISGTTSDANRGGGVGVYAGGSGGHSPTLLLTDTTITAHDYAAVWLDGPGSYVLSGNTLEGGPGFAPWDGAWWHGDAVYATGGIDAWDDAAATGLLLEDNTLRDGRHGVFLHGASALLDGNAWSGNATDLWQQRCDLAEAVTDDLPDAAEICPEGERLVSTLDFAGLYLEEAEAIE